MCTVGLERTRVNTVRIFVPEINLSRVCRSGHPPAMATFGNGQRSTKTAAPGPAGVRAVRPGCAPYATSTAGARAAIWGESLRRKRIPMCGDQNAFWFWLIRPPASPSALTLCFARTLV